MYSDMKSLRLWPDGFNRRVAVKLIFLFIICIDRILKKIRAIYYRSLDVRYHDFLRDEEIVSRKKLTEEFSDEARPVIITPFTGNFVRSFAE